MAYQNILWYLSRYKISVLDPFCRDGGKRRWVARQKGCIPDDHAHGLIVALLVLRVVGSLANGKLLA